MAHSSFGSGWPNCQPSKIVTLVRSDGLRLPLHRDLVGLVSLLIDLTELSGYDVKPGETWGYACRPVSGTRTASNHSWGTAVDINAPSNPYASALWHQRNARGTRPFGLALVTNIPQQVVELWEAHGFRWGGRYGGKPDPMHFEFMGSVAEAKAHETRLRQFLAGNGKPAPPAPKPAPPSSSTPRVLRLTSPMMKGGDVKDLQRLLIALGYLPARSDDGVFGPKTEAAVRRLQQAMNVPADGMYGPVTRTAVERTLRFAASLPKPQSGTDWEMVAAIDAAYRKVPYAGVLAQGSSGRAVEAVQWRLSANGFATSVDGKFGPKTAANVVAFQRSRRIAVDGKVGPVTWTSLGLLKP